MVKSKNSKLFSNLIYIQGIYALAFLVIISITYLFLQEINSGVKNFTKNDYRLLLTTNKISFLISEQKALVLKSSLRKGEDYSELEKIKSNSREIEKELEFIKELSKNVAIDISASIEEIIKNVDYLQSVSLSMAKDFKSSYEEGLDTLGAIEVIEQNLEFMREKISSKVLENGNSQIEYFEGKISSSIWYMVGIALVAGLLSHVLNLSILKLLKAREKLQNDLEKNSAELQQNLLSMYEYKEAVELATYLVKVDREGCITEVNDRFLELTGYDYNELINQNIKELNVFGGEAENKKILEAIKKGDFQHGNIRSYKKNLEPLYINYELNPLFSMEGEVKEFLLLFQDETANEIERVNELESSLDKALVINWQKVLDSTPLPGLIVDNKSKIENVNGLFKDLFFTFGCLEKAIEENCYIDSYITIEENIYLTGIIDWKEEILTLRDDEEVYAEVEGESFKIKASLIHDNKYLILLIKS